MRKSVTLGFKYRMYPNDIQKEILNHQMFISNQAYNICVNLKQKEWEINKDLEQNELKYLKATELDSIVKKQLRERNLPFKTVTTQQARKNSEKAYKNMFESGFGSPKFKNSKFEKQSFTWNNQEFQIINKNDKFKYLRLWKENIPVRFYRDLPENYKLNSIHISRDGGKYFVSFSVTFDVPIDENIDISKAIGIDLNIHDIAFQFLDYKTSMLNGKHFLKVPPHYTSKTCNTCGFVKRDLTLKDRVFNCPECGYSEHRDINASKNILKKGLQSFELGNSSSTKKKKSLVNSVSSSDKVS
jgi:transposase